MPANALYRHARTFMLYAPRPARRRDAGNRISSAPRSRTVPSARAWNGGCCEAAYAHRLAHRLLLVGHNARDLPAWFAGIRRREAAYTRPVVSPPAPGDRIARDFPARLVGFRGLEAGGRGRRSGCPARREGRPLGGQRRPAAAPAICSASLTAPGAVGLGRAVVVQAGVEWLRFSWAISASASASRRDGRAASG